MNATKPRKKARWLLTAAVLAAAAGGIYYARTSMQADTGPTVMTAPVRKGTIEETVLATGILKPAKLVAVGAQASGRITSLKVSLGQELKAGDLVAEIDATTQTNNLRTSEAALANVEAQRVEKEASLRLASISLERQQKLLAQNATSRADFDTADSEVKTIEAQIKALDAQIIEAQVAVETAKANLGYTRITAPMDGTVLAIVNQQGQTVNATQSAPTIIIMGQLDVMTVRAEISEADVVKVKPGAEVYFNVLGAPDTKYQAHLESIEPAPESITSDSSVSGSSTSSSSSSTSTEAIYYNGIFNVPNPDGLLRTYMTAEVTIVLGKAENVPVIPATALGARNADGSYNVQVMGGTGTIETRRVKTGLNDKINVEIKSGLSEGDRVVTGTLDASAARTFTPRGPGGPAMGI
ncbi:efflux RND transporter periplasmic adaptor subunit [Pannonibacter indicus]|uniref:RND family efflux transporter, MFP subunit n=1 Tax=Pannonibacter indicus TaxID=466044 RepID=A0A0K6HPZ8_9HYPH|nr:efflux RND transporter periplasmic adaptor subunit [Pannonibacter indicus]CUA93077.1 RND family efflux transporter, MFP subunit [Pannonibacter indicus]